MKRLLQAFYFSIFFLLVVSAFGQEKKEVKILHADRLVFDDSRGNNAKRLIGNVGFQQENTFMYCDSAYFYSETNSMDAYGNVKILEGDSLSIKGNTLNYDGNTKYGKLRGNIVMEDGKMTLTTDYLDFDRENGYAFYLGGGKIVNHEEKTTLTSEKGYYFPDSKLFQFKKDVHLVSDDYKIKSDTLHFNNQKRITYFFGPTQIWLDSTYIYCERGWFDEEKEFANFVHKARIENEQQILSADSILFDDANEMGWMYGNVEIEDTVESFIVRGEYGEHNKQDSTSLVVGRALLIQVFDNDSFYLHGDTLFSTFDSTRKHRVIHAYHKVKFFKEDLAGKCDSLVFSDADSLIKMFYDPVIWASGNQLTGGYIQIKNYNGKVHWMEMIERSFIITEEDTGKYNQIAGKYTKNFFKDGKLDRISVKGNGKTLYYAREEDDGSYIGVNQATCEDLYIYLDSNEVRKIKFYQEPVSKLSPLDQIAKSELLLTGFSWRIKEKPMKPEDVFIWETSEGEPTTPKTSSAN